MTSSKVPSRRLRKSRSQGGGSASAGVGRLGLFHTLRPLFVGLVHGLAGSAAVALLVLSTIREPKWAVLYLLIFGVGTIAGMMSKTGTIGYLGSFKIPEIIMGVNAFALSAQAINPNIKVKLVMIDTWFDPAKEAAATETLINLGCDFVTTHTDSPAAPPDQRHSELKGLEIARS